MSQSKIRKIGVFTSGGDAPGMNACIRAVVRTAIYHGIEAIGIIRGYEGMIDGNFISLNRSSVSGIIHRGGTILKSARSERFFKKEFREVAYKQLKANNIDGLVAIGGDGTFRGALQLHSEFPDIHIVGVPGTIDNDLYGTDYTIGFDTAVNTAVEAIDKIRDTADSHDRLFFIEVMGRDAGLIALHSGISCGAEDILIPEIKTDLSGLVEKLKEGKKRGKQSSIVIVAEGDDAGGAFKIVEQIKPHLNEYNIRIAILGHIQRGGSPTALDRLQSSEMGMAAVEALINGKKNLMIGIQNKQIVEIPFEKATKQHPDISPQMKKMIEILS
jgi:6-phosphofructokinase 1